MTDGERAPGGSMRQMVSDVIKPAGVGVGVTVLASLVPFVGVLAPAIGGGVASRVGSSGDGNGPRVGLTTGALVVLLSLPMTFLAVAVAATVSPIATVGVLGTTLAGAAYVVGSSALGGYLADEFAGDRRDREDAVWESTPATTETSAEPIERLKRRYVDGEIDDDEFERRLERLVADEGTAERPAEDATRLTDDAEE
jgi:hypothetical protein